MPAPTKGEKWIKLLRSYGPVADNEAMQAEHVGKFAAHLDVPKLAFNHPAHQLILDCFPVSTGLFHNLVLTGTAGEGKTSLCFELVHALTGKSAEGLENRFEKCGGFAFKSAAPECCLVV